MKSIKLNHIALRNRSVELADKFYHQLLGLEKIYQFNLEAELVNKIFGIKNDFFVIIYGNSNFRIELFIGPQEIPFTPTLNHLCIEVKDRNKLYEQAQSLGLETTVIPKGDRKNIFIRDFDGNLFEIKQQD